MVAKSKGQFETNIAGITFNNDDGTNRQEIMRKCTIGERLILTHTPIKQDNNAVKVTRTSGEQIGWLHDFVAKEIAPILDKGKTVSAEITELSTFINESGKRMPKCRILLTKLVK
jgi:hypothetical protein